MRGRAKVISMHHAVACAECDERLHASAWIHLTDDERARCLSCAGLEHLEFVASGNAALTRRATRESKLSAVVLQWNKRRKRYERLGILVESDALSRAKSDCLLDSEARARRRQRASERREAQAEKFVLAFAARIRAAFPCCPPDRERVIAEHACAKGTRRVGRTAMAKTFDGGAILLAVRAHVRHQETRYDALLASGMQVWAARRAVQARIDEILAEWRGAETNDPRIAASCPPPTKGVVFRRRAP